MEKVKKKQVVFISSRRCQLYVVLKSLFQIHDPLLVFIFVAIKTPFRDLLILSFCARFIFQRISYLMFYISVDFYEKGINFFANIQYISKGIKKRNLDKKELYLLLNIYLNEKTFF